MAGPERQRIDRWLFFARAVKSRSLAAKLVQGGAVRLNRDKIDQAAHPVRAGDVLTIKLERRILVWRILETGTRRGPAEEARALYEDMTPKPPAPDEAASTPAREPGAGRPTKKDRREMERWRGEG